MGVSADHPPDAGNYLEVAQYGTTVEQQHIRTPAETCSLTLLEGPPSPPRLLVEKSKEAFQISLHWKRAYMKSTGLADRPVAFILESWPKSSRAFVFFCSSVELAQTWIEKLRISGCVMSDWQKKCTGLKTLSKTSDDSASKAEIIHAIMKPREAGAPRNQVVMKVADADQLDDIFSEAYLLSRLCGECDDVVGGANGLYEVVKSGRRTLALVMDARIAKCLQDARTTHDGRPEMINALSSELTKSPVLFTIDE
jgi:hypothetical protein